jgi:hypothetical protein
MHSHDTEACSCCRSQAGGYTCQYVLGQLRVTEELSGGAHSDTDASDPTPEDGNVVQIARETLKRACGTSVGVGNLGSTSQVKGAPRSFGKLSLTVDVRSPKLERSRTQEIVDHTPKL